PPPPGFHGGPGCTVRGRGGDRRGPAHAAVSRARAPPVRIGAARAHRLAAPPRAGTAPPPDARRAPAPGRGPARRLRLAGGSGGDLAVRRGGGRRPRI